MNEEQNIIPDNLDNNSCSVSWWESMKQEVLVAVDEKFDVEAVAQMVEHLDFSKKLNVSLQRSFQSLQAELQRKDQMIQYLQGRLDNLELDIALLKRTIVSPSPFLPPPAVPLPQVVLPAEPHFTWTKQDSESPQPDTSTTNIRPPDFSKLREMTVAEPTNKFVPPPSPSS